VVLPILALALAVAGCGLGGGGLFAPANPTGDDTGNPQVQDVSITDTGYNPSTVRIAVGDSVLWTNNGATDHTVTSGNPGDPDAGSVFGSGPIAPGATFTFTFNVTGDFVYFSTSQPLVLRNAHVIVE
jgi:plastocyanin